MPQPDLQKFDRRAIVIAPAGTPLNNASHGLMLLDGSSQRDADTVERNIDTPYLGAKPSQRTNFRATINGDIEIRPPIEPGHATDGIPPTDNALLPCGLARTVSDLLGVTRYSPVSTDFAAADMSFWHASTYLEVLAAQGDLSQIRSEIGQAFKARLALTGPYDEISEDALPEDVDLSAFEGDPTVAEPENTELTVTSDEDEPEIDGLHLWGKSLITNLGQQVTVKQFTELRRSGITGRGASATVVFAKPDFDEFNPDAYFRNRKRLIFAFKHKEPDGRYTLHWVRGQVDQVRDTNVDNDLCYELTLGLVPAGPAGNNEFGIEFGDDTFRIRGTWPGGTEDVVYAAGAGIVVAGEFVGPVTYAVTDGALPTGLALSGGGVLSGTPTAADTYTFEVTATDSTPGTPKTATREFTITIAA